MFFEYKIHLENLEIKQFAPLLQKARKTAASWKTNERTWKTNERTWKTSERSKTDKSNAPQALLVAANEPASKKREKGRAVEEYPPIPCTAEELSVILDRWIADGVVKLYKIDREPTEEDKKHSRFCCYHRYVHHPTLECRYIRRMFHEKLADDTLEVGRGTQGVQRNPLPQHDRGKGIVAVVIHAGDEEEDPMISATLTPAAIKTLQRSPAFCSLFNQLGLTPEARTAATEAIVGIASSSGSHCFTAEAHASRAFLETTNAVTFTDEDMEVQYPDHKRPLYVPAMINEVHGRLNGKPIRIPANPTLFDQSEAHYLEVAFYDQLTMNGGDAIAKPVGTPLPSWEDVKRGSEVDLRDLLERKKKRKERKETTHDAPRCEKFQLPDGRIVYRL
nr:hypothetical protein CFP56_24214 [Quercus suber]